MDQGPSCREAACLTCCWAPEERASWSVTLVIWVVVVLLVVSDVMVWAVSKTPGSRSPLLSSVCRREGNNPSLCLAGSFVGKRCRVQVCSSAVHSKLETWFLYSDLSLSLFKKIFLPFPLLFLFLLFYWERKKEGEQEGEKHHALIHFILYAPTVEQTHNLGMCPGQGSNPQPSGFQDDAQPTETLWTGLQWSLKK